MKAAGVLTDTVGRGYSLGADVERSGRLKLIISTNRTEN